MKITKLWVKATLYVVVLYVIICFGIRSVLFFCQERVFGEWTNYMDEISAEMPQERHPFPHDYYMHSVFEVYAVKQFRFTDDGETLTEEEIKKRFMPLVDSANNRFGGNDAMLYVGHDDPYRITPKYFIAKPLHWFSKSESGNTNRWHVIIYKRARNPFKL